jgi:hypothetical protein
MSSSWSSWGFQHLSQKFSSGSSSSSGGAGGNTAGAKIEMMAQVLTKVGSS